MSAHSHIDTLLSGNSQWIAHITASDPEFLPESVQGQTPGTLWIGCSDSRVPESVITSSRPGEIFVQRNIANQARLDDVSTIAALRFAVDVLGVQHVVVVGHSDCGAAEASWNAVSPPRHESGLPEGDFATVPDFPVDDPLNRWLEPLTRFAGSLNTPVGRNPVEFLIEENVKRQVAEISDTQIVKEVWSKRDLAIHGWVYELGTGRLRDLKVTRSRPAA
ncbi:hypothetical protein H0H81_000268 [Sphagnurus paluster]|uniref:Carbonic anhydrase n=1 Tax=Sphagnurus paluster TaxID=117069 RepID=A0A9P7K4K1_9AGAR|nr:hypothetical protein H0H81_000268 [Sphagnurus paluster]